MRPNNQRKLGIGMMQPRTGKDLFADLGIPRGNYAPKMSSPQRRVGRLDLEYDEFGNPRGGYSQPGRAKTPMRSMGIRGGFRGASATDREAQWELMQRVARQEQLIEEQALGLEELRQSQIPVSPEAEQALPDTPGGEEPEPVYSDPGPII